MRYQLDGQQINASTCDQCIDVNEQVLYDFLEQTIMTSREGWTNNVLLERLKEKIIYYVPCYLRLKVKNFVSLSIASQEAEINADLIFTLFYSTLPSYIVDELCENIIFQFNRSDAIQLTRSIEISLTKNEKHQTLSFTIRKNLKAKVECNFFWSPFELIYLALVVTIRSLNIDNPLDAAKPILVRFNLMDHQSKFVKVSHTREDTFGNYRLAPFKLRVHYSSELYYDPHHQFQLPQDEESQLISLDDGPLSNSAEQLHGELEVAEHNEKLRYFQYAHFVIPMYKYPFISLSTIFFPMWSLALYNLFMYYEGTDMSMRIINGVTLDLSLFAYIPTIRQQLPDTPNILLVQLLVYSITLTFHFTLIDSYQVSTFDNATYQMVWTENIWFLMSMIITVLSVLILAVLGILHKLVWEPQYLSGDQSESTQQKFSRLAWKNNQCDRYFEKFTHIRVVN